MNAIDLLKRQHRRLERLFDKLERSGPRGAARGVLVESLVDSLATHLALEETHLYPRAADFSRAGAQEEALAEHRYMKDLLADLAELDPAAPQAEARLAELRGLLELHVDHEEAELFAALEQLIDEPELLEMGLAMAAQAREQRTPEVGYVQPGREPIFD